MKAIILLGSSRSFGNTRQAIHLTFSGLEIPLIDLQTKVVGPYDYSYQNQGDDFFSIIQELLTYDLWSFATPVYWYSMSATLKAFVDRLSDLLDIHKHIGRQLRGKKLFVVASFNTSYPRGFEDTFEQTCGYLGITYLGTSFIYSGTENAEFLKSNSHYIAKARALFSLS